MATSELAWLRRHGGDFINNRNALALVPGVVRKTRVKITPTFAQKQASKKKQKKKK
jgi:hypothetical protein